MRVVSAPFLQPETDRLLTEPWQIALGSGSHALPAYIPHWDTNVNLRLARSIVIDVDAVRADCQIKVAPLQLIAVWQSSGTWIRGAGTRVDLAASGVQVAVLQVEVPGSDLAVDVEVTSQLVLASRGDDAPPAARLPGSILWQDHASVALEGTASRFPTEVVDFEKTVWAPKGAGWFLVWNSDDLHQPLLKGLRLFLNARHTAVLEAVRTASPTADQKAIRSAIYYDVGSALIRGALRNEEFVDGEAAYADASIGRALRRLISGLFPGESYPSLRSASEERADFFGSKLQAAFRIFPT